MLFNQQTSIPLFGLELLQEDNYNSEMCRSDLRLQPLNILFSKIWDFAELWFILTLYSYPLHLLTSGFCA